MADTRARGSEKANMPNAQAGQWRNFDEAFKRDAVALLIERTDMLGKAPY